MKRCRKCRSTDIKQMPKKPGYGKMTFYKCFSCEELTPKYLLLDLPDERTKMKFSLSFLWFDLWVGFYVDKKGRALYFCPLPMIVFKFQLHNVYICEFCDHDMHQAAHDTGDGWWLGYECGECDHIHDLEDHWPWGDERVSADDLRDRGWVIV